MGLLDLFIRRERKVQTLMARYMDIWIACMRAFRDAWDIYLADGITEEFLYRVDATHKEESRADDMRREIEHELYAKALIPESRGDILGTLETVDRLLTEAEWSLYEVQLQEIKIPEPIRPNIVKVVDLTCCCCEMVNKAVRALFVSGGRAADIEDLINEVDNCESEVDHLERSLIRTIFKLDIYTGEKLVLKALVRRLTKVSDGAEHVGDRLTVISVKRRV
jgi:predicted phosphate transport protein (TIGR00153 family)